MRTPEEKIHRAMGRITMKHPFFGSFIPRTNFEMVNSPHRVSTMATDGRTIWWNYEFVDGLTNEEVEGVVIHEVLHIVLKHMLRRNDRNPRKWNIACDYVIDPIVLSIGGDSPPTLPGGPGLEHHHDTQYDGKTAEHVYELLPDDEEHTGEGGSMVSIGDIEDMKNEDGSPMSPDEVERMSVEIDQMVITAAEAAKRAGKLPAGIDEYVKSLRDPKVDLEDHLHRFIGGEHPEGYTFKRIARAPHWYGGMIEPSIERVGCGTIVIGLDVSGSMSTKELEYCGGLLKSLTEEYNPDTVIVIQHDAVVTKVDEYEAGEWVDDLKVKGRGGTRVQPVFEYIREHDINPDKLIMVTDMGIFDFGEPEPWDTLWVSSTKESAPWGDTAYMVIK